MLVFITGVLGQLGHDVAWEAIRRGNTVIGSDLASTGGHTEDFLYRSLDITDREAVFRTIAETKPDCIVHCAAWTMVDAAEEPKNRERVYSINVNGTHNLAEAAKAVDAKMLYISTDYVFDGQGDQPWDPDCKTFAPLNVYGDSKWKGELAVSSILQKYWIVRIAWVFGRNGNNFVKTMLRIGRTNETVRVVNDQIGTPTYTVDLARLLVDMLLSEQYGYYHATNSEVQTVENGDWQSSPKSGYISWYDFAVEIFRLKGLGTQVIPVTTKAYGRNLAERPFNSRLDKSKLLQKGFKPLPTWHDALQRFLKEIDSDGTDND